MQIGVGFSAPAHEQAQQDPQGEAHHQPEEDPGGGDRQRRLQRDSLLNEGIELVAGVVMVVLGAGLQLDTAPHQGSERLGKFPRRRDEVGPRDQTRHQGVGPDQRCDGDQPEERAPDDGAPPIRGSSP